MNMQFFHDPKLLEKMIKEVNGFFDEKQSKIFKMMLYGTSDRQSLKQMIDNAKRNWKLE